MAKQPIIQPIMEPGSDKQNPTIFAHWSHGFMTLQLQYLMVVLALSWKKEEIIHDDSKTAFEVQILLP